LKSLRRLLGEKPCLRYRYQAAALACQPDLCDGHRRQSVLSESMFLNLGRETEFICVRRRTTRADPWVMQAIQVHQKAIDRSASTLLNMKSLVVLVVVGSSPKTGRTIGPHELRVWGCEPQPDSFSFVDPALSFHVAPQIYETLGQLLVPLWKR
jgi:hypothetical protein